jgi:acyl-CoA thioesterase I
MTMAHHIMTCKRLHAIVIRAIALFLCIAPPEIAICDAAAASQATILVYGDSLSAAHGIRQEQGWAALLQERLKAAGFDYAVANASISGETSSGGASRIAATLARTKPKITVLELGANDGLRGLPIAQMRDNLGAIIRAARNAGSKVLLVGMKLPPNYGPEYVREFEAAYAKLARQHALALVPFMLEGIADKAELFQQDQLHPVAKAQALILENVWKELRPLLSK